MEDNKKSTEKENNKTSMSFETGGGQITATPTEEVSAETPVSA